MFSKLKQFDMHIKAVEGVNQQTILGACITLISTFLVIVLLISEINLFLKIDVVSRMVADNSAGVESIQLVFDIDLYHVSCERINFLQEVTRGTLHTHEPITIEKNAIQPSGCKVKGSIITDKVGGNFRFGIEPEKVVNNKMHPIPGVANSIQNQLTLNANISHKINLIIFLPTKGKSAIDKIPGLSKSLTDQSTIVPTETAIYQYAIQVKYLIII